MVKKNQIRKQKIVRVSDDIYKNLYVNLKKQFEEYLRHKRHHAQRCKGCRKDYREAVDKIKTIRNSKLREDLLEMFSILWDNNCLDFDIINYSLGGNYGGSSDEK